jgi:hypothetical protein
VLGRELDYACAVRREYALDGREETVRAVFGSSIERGRKIVGGPNVANVQRDTQRARCSPQLLYL